MQITAAQCRAARALLDWTQDQLAENAQVARATVADFERNTRFVLMRQNLVAITSALEAAGIEFIPDNGAGVGVRFRKVELEFSKTVKPVPNSDNFPVHDDFGIMVRYRGVEYLAIISREVIDDIDRTNARSFAERAGIVQKHLPIFLRAIELKLIAGDIVERNRVIIDTNSLPEGAL